MTFAQSLAAAASLTEATLDRILAEKNLIGEAPEPQSGRLIAAMRHAVLGGGKRVRPLLVIESAAMFGVAPENAALTAAALELVHCYSLAHDDLPAMDNDELRRGRPTVWKAYDEWTAILAGDALLTLAFDVLARPENHPDAAVRIALVSSLARSSGVAGMVGGQALDLMADKLGDPSAPTVEHIRRLQAMKTGALLVFACEAGAILGRASEKERKSLIEFGTALGFAFQIADDLLDAEGDAATVGKAVAKDAAANKATLVSLMGIPAAKDMLARTEAAAGEALMIFGSRADVLRDAAHFVVTRKS
ncbi:MAG: polyprenyl synthetase family protein [Deltaproteobacteria bacterium]